MTSNNMTPSIIAMQEDAMWAEYRAEQQPEPVFDNTSVEKRSEAIVPSVDLDEESGYSRFSVTASGPSHLYPAEKQGQTTKDRRYRPQVKFSDRDKALGKIPGRKDKSYRQLKHEASSTDGI